MFDDIQRVNILLILDKIWLDYVNVGMDEYRMNWTDGWSINIADNIITDFSNKNRAVWWPFAFIKTYLKLDDKETFNWFEENFNIKNQNMKQKKEIKVDIKKTWDELPTPSQIQIDYLKSRWIEYTKIEWIIKSFRGWIWALVYNNTWVIWLTARMLEWNTRFTSLKWSNWKWVYLHKLNKTKKQIIVVEWLIDFLTLRQYTSNVVWLKSANDWIDIIQQLADKYEIVIIPDNDEPWQKIIKQLWDLIEFKIFDLKKYWVKDINELEVKENLWENLVNYILENTEEIEDDFSELWEVSPYTWGLDWIDNKFWKFYPWDFIVIVWESWHWKTEFSLFQAIQNSKKNKVCYITLEMTPWNLVKRLATKKAWITILEDNTKNIPENKIEIYKQEKKKIIKNKNLNFVAPEKADIDWVIEIIREKAKIWIWLFYLDNFWFVIWSWRQNEIEVMSELSRRLKQLTNELWIVIIWLHHFNKWNSKSRTSARWISDMRWSWKIENDIDYWFTIFRDTNDTDEISKEVRVIISKNRRNWLVWDLDIFFDNWLYKENNF